MKNSVRVAGPAMGHTLGIAAQVRAAVSDARLCDLAGRPPVETLGDLVGRLRRIVGEADQPDAAVATPDQASTSVWILESGLATETEILGVFATRGLAIQAAEHEEAPSSSWQRVRDELVWRDRSYRMDISEHPVEHRSRFDLELPVRCPHVDPQWGQCALAEGHALDHLPEDTYTGSLSLLSLALWGLWYAIIDALDRRLRSVVLRLEAALQRVRRWLAR